MEDHYTRPAVWAKPRGKYGRQEYERLDHKSLTHTQAGRGSIGKVEVDCRFMYTKSHWGVIGESKTPAGIIYVSHNPCCLCPFLAVSGAQGLPRHRFYS